MYICVCGGLLIEHLRNSFLIINLFFFFFLFLISFSFSPVEYLSVNYFVPLYHGYLSWYKGKKYCLLNKSLNYLSLITLVVPMVKTYFFFFCVMIGIVVSGNARTLYNIIGSKENYKRFMYSLNGIYVEYMYMQKKCIYTYIFMYINYSCAHFYFSFFFFFL